MAKKIVRGITDVKTINNQDFDTNNVNDLLSDGQYNYIHRKKGKSEEYHNLTDNIKTISSDNTDLLTVTNNNKTNNTATLSPKHDAQKEQVLESERATITIQHGTNGTSEKTKVDTNPAKVLEHENLLCGDGLQVSHSGNISEIQLEPSLKNAVKGLRKISTSAGIVAPYNDLNTLPVNTIVLYAYFDGVANKPTGVNGGATVLTYNHASGSDISGAVQILTAPNGDIYTRNFWGMPGTDVWRPWKKMATEYDFNPSLALFEKIGVIGDSYASGEIFPDGTPVDQYSISWGQILARKNGVSCTNFSAGGLTTRHWLLNKNGLTKLNATEPQNLYYISLGINDKNNLGIEYIGTEADMDSQADTFYGNYAKIINAIKAKAPHAKIILIDYAWSTGKTDPYFIATKNIATKFGLPLIKHSDDPYLASQQFKTDLMSHGHPVAISYAAMASAFERLTMQAIRDNIEYFKDYRG